MGKESVIERVQLMVPVIAFDPVSYQSQNGVTLGRLVRGQPWARPQFD